MSVSSKRKGSNYEREVARTIGAKRTPLSGADGGNDLTFEQDHIWADWGVELKRRKMLPASILSWLAQAEYALPIGSQKQPAVVMRQDHGRSIFVAYLDDVIAWSSALAETGQGQKARAIARQLRVAADALEKIA